MIQEYLYNELNQYLFNMFNLFFIFVKSNLKNYYLYIILINKAGK